MKMEVGANAVRYVFDYSTIDDLLGSLPPLQEKIIRWHFGIGVWHPPEDTIVPPRHRGINIDSNGHTVEEIAELLKINRSAVQTIESNAIKALNSPLRLEAFKDIITRHKQLERFFQNNRPSNSGQYPPVINEILNNNQPPEGVVALAKAVFGSYTAIEMMISPGRSKKFPKALHQEPNP